MGIASVRNAVTRAGHIGALRVRKYSPEILIAVGITGFVAAAITAVKAGTKLEAVVQHGTERVEDAKALARYEENGETIVSEDALRKELTKAYVLNVFDLVKLFAPTGSLVVGSTGCVLAARGIMKRREVALVAAYLMERSFANYRQRVEERLGIEDERDLYRGDISREEVTDEKTGVKQVVTLAGPGGKAPSPYARIFDKYSSEVWDPHPHYNQAWLISQQELFNWKLQSHGYVFLSDVYKALGFRETEASRMVGWVASDDKNHVGDNHIDFNIFDLRDPAKRAFINGDEEAIWLDFNVDGIILDKIDAINRI